MNYTGQEAVNAVELNVVGGPQWCSQVMIRVTPLSTITIDIINLKLQSYSTIQQREHARLRRRPPGEAERSP